MQLITGCAVAKAEQPGRLPGGYDLIASADKIIAGVQSINKLLKEKNKIINKIGAIMNFKAYARTKMSKTQIRQFVLFNRECADNANRLSEIFGEIDAILKSGFVAYPPDGNSIYVHKRNSNPDIREKFADILERQEIAANILREILALGNYTVFILGKKQ